MTGAEQDEALGRAVRAYVATTDRITELEREVVGAKAVLDRYRDRIHQPGIIDATTPEDIQQAAAAIGESLIELKSAVQTKAELERCLERAGVPAFLSSD